MEDLKVPAGYQAVMPYLIVKDAAGFLTFLHTVFGAQEKEKHEDANRGIMHAEVKIGDSIVMLADSTGIWAATPGSMFVYVPNADETYRKALDQGSTSLTEPADQPYGRSCGIRDPYGNVWWITSAL